MNLTPPLYGRIEVGKQLSLATLLERLQRISRDYLGGASFHAYLSNDTGETFYGLSQSELFALYQQHEGSVSTIALFASTDTDKVVRLSIRFALGLKKAKAQFVIVGASPQENEHIKSILLDRPLAASSLAFLSRIAPKQEAPPQTLDPHPESSPQPLSLTDDYTDVSIRLVERFRFNQQIQVDHLLELLDRLSTYFFYGLSFHAELDTTDGDYYFDIQRGELKYLFNYRRHTLLTLYLDVATYDGRWIDMMLSFHPLEQGATAEMEVSAPTDAIDHITTLIWEYLAVETQGPPAQPINSPFNFEQAQFSIDQLCELFRELSSRYLHNIPPLAFFSTQNGDSYTGLTLYQLQSVAKRHEDTPYASVSIGISRVMTGQSLSLMFNFLPQASGSLSMVWGDKEMQEQIKNLIWKRLRLH